MEAASDHSQSDAQTETKCMKSMNSMARKDVRADSERLVLATNLLLCRFTSTPPTAHTQSLSEGLNMCALVCVSGFHIRAVWRPLGQIRLKLRPRHLCWR